MANKKISQLVGMGAGETVSGFYLLPVGAGPNGGPYVTKKITTKELADFIFTGDNSTYVGFPATTLSGVNKEIYFNNDDANWNTASNVVTQNPYLQVRASDGLLVTGSGIGAAVGGDNMGNCVATTTLNMQNNSITNVASLFFNTTASTVLDEDGQNLVMQAARDMTVSGIRHVHISGQALSLASTPISGDVNISRGLNFQGGDVSITNNSTGTLTVDNIVLNKTSKHEVYSVGASDTEIDWSESNIQKSSDGSTINYYFTNAAQGQTLTMYIDNSSTSQSIIPTFASGAADQNPNSVLWGGTGGPPHIDTHRTNVYTFICIETGIFASAVTGYEYT
jgi:hypothetical protein